MQAHSPSQFSKDTQMASKHVKRCPTPLVIGEMPIKTTSRYYFTPTGTAIIKKKRSVGRDVEKLKPSYPAGRNVKRCS